MGAAAGARAAFVALLAGGLLAGGPTVAAANPLFGPPVIGKARWGGEDGDAVAAGLVLDVRLLGILGGRRLSIWPDRQLGIEPGEPLAAALRLGGVLHLVEAPWSFVVPIDLAELMRPAQAGVRPWQQPVGTFAGALVDDAYVMWRPSGTAQLVLGRARVPFSKWRQFEERDIALGGVPFVVDRVAPDRRWGLLLTGDLGALAYAAGAWEDLDALEPRAPEDDPSRAGRVLTAAHVEWTPIAPMMGSNPVGKVRGARGPLPTPREDPWFATPRVSLGLGVLWRLGETGEQRYDASLSLQWKWRWLALLTEGLLLDGQDLGVHGELAVTPYDHLSLHARADWDPGPVHPAWTAGAGVMWHATADRRNRVGFYGWYRRADDRPEDAAVVLIQTSL